MGELIFWISLFSQAITMIVMVAFAIIIFSFRKEIISRLCQKGNKRDDEFNDLQRNDNHFI